MKRLRAALAVLQETTERRTGPICRCACGGHASHHLLVPADHVADLARQHASLVARLVECRRRPGHLSGDAPGDEFEGFLLRDQFPETGRRDDGRDG
jgi:hypothetical protein